MRARVRIAVVGVALASALGLSGCGEAGVAATVNGQVITEQQAQEAAAQINEAFQLQKPLTTQDVVASLITAPFIIRAAEQSGKPQSASAARAAMPTLNDPSQATVDLVRANAAVRTLNQQEQQQILDEIGKADLTVNPRYGTFTPERGLVNEPPNWIASSDAKG